MVGIKPTVGLTSRAGVVPISHTQDTVGPHGRTVADAAIALGVIQSRTFDGRDPATGGVPLGWEGRSRPTDIPSDYTQFLNPHALRGARLGLVRTPIGFNAPPPALATPVQVSTAFDQVVAALTAAGATVIDLDAAGFTGFGPGFAADELLGLKFRGHQTQELLGQRDLNMKEVTAAIGRAIGRPELQYRQISYDQFRGILVQMGASQPTADLMVEMAEAQNSGYVRSLEARSQRNTTPTSYEDFVAEEFVPAYRASSAGVTPARV